MATRTTVPPTAPPAIAPTFVLDPLVEVELVVGAADDGTGRVVEDGTGRVAPRDAAR